MNKLIIILMLLAFIPVSQAVSPFGTFNLSDNETMIIEDIANIDYLNDYNYMVFINGSYSGDFHHEEAIFYPNNSKVIIYLPDKVNMDLTESYDIGKVYLTLGVMYFVGFGVLIVLIVLIARKILTRRR